MANKLWVGTQSAFDQLSSKPLNDYFSTKSNETYTFSYHSAPAFDTIKNMSYDTFVTISSDGSCTPKTISEMASRYSMSSATKNLSLPRLYKYYRGKGGNLYRVYIRSSNSWQKIGDMYRDTSVSPEGSETGLTNYIVVDSLPSSGINASKIYLVKYDGTDSTESLFGSKTLAGITTETRNKYFY